MSAIYSFMAKVYYDLLNTPSACGGELHFKFENLVLWARSEIIGSACNSFKE
jgi:hypothetical protein